MYRFKLMVLLLIVGLLIFMYPAVSDYWNAFTQTRAISKYEKTVSDLGDKDYEAEFAKARKYNRRLMRLSDPLVDYSEIGKADDIFNVNGDGVIGYITIEKIGLRLPVYYGTSDEVLNVAVGLMEGTGFPVGRKGTHSVLSGHRGLSSAELFTHVNRLRKGDTFSVTVLNQVFTYRVDRILTVKPTDVSALSVDVNKDYCSLVTCTPYGINTHRLIIRGERTEKPDVRVQTEDNTNKINGVIVFAALITALLITLVIILIRKVG